MLISIMLKIIPQLQVFLDFLLTIKKKNKSAAQIAVLLLLRQKSE